jgi:hypothetical protein
MAMKQISTRIWRKWLFYLDLLIIAIFVISLVSLVQDAYLAGVYSGRGSNTLQDLQFWYMIRDVAFVACSIAWIFYRFFKCQFDLTKGPW